MIKVVVIEDEELLRKGLIYTFDWQKQGYMVIGEAQNGHEGKLLIEKLKPDVVITDIKMPLMDGLEMLQSLKELRFEAIVMTGYAEFEYAKKAIELGVSHFVLKPIDDVKLNEVLVKVSESILLQQEVMHYKEHYHLTSEIDLFEGKLTMLSNISHDRMVKQALEYIHEHWNERISLDSLAAHVDMSTGYVSRTFKKVTTFNVGEYINRYRIQKAIELLMEDRYKLYEIAQMCGFKDYKYFHHVFTQYVKRSPKEFISSKYIVKSSK